MDPQQIAQMLQTLAAHVPTIEKYKQHTTEESIPQVIEKLPAGGSIGWYGSTTAKRVIGYIPGGALVTHASVFQVQMAYDVYKDAKSLRKDDTALAILSYDVCTESPYPAQVDQAARFIELLLKGRTANDIDLFGESAGGTLIIASLLHLKHPHPKVAPLSLPSEQRLGRILLISPSATIKTSAASFTENKDKDSFTSEILEYLWSQLEQNHDADIPLVNPWLAPALKLEESWYDALPVASISIIWGQDEILRDDIAKVSAVIKARSGVPVTLYEAPGAGHCPFVRERMANSPPSEYSQAISRWGQSN